jgi:hypothetical protein
MDEEELIRRLKKRVSRGAWWHLFAQRVFTDLPSGRHWNWERRLPRPASPDLVAGAEQTLGFSLPPLLRRIYLEVADGGFGPGYGLFGIADGPPFHDTLIEYYKEEHWAANWPERFLRVCHWGCEIYSCIDCTNDSFPMVLYDGSFSGHLQTFHEWMKAWVNGVDLFKNRG